MTTDTQKKQEIRFARRAAELLVEEWQVRCAPNEESWPDLIVESSGITFGLEVRELYPDESKKGSKKRENESLHIASISALAKKYYKSSCVPIRVNILGSIEQEEVILESLLQSIERLGDLEQARLEPYEGCVAYVLKLPSNFGKYMRWSYISDKVGWVGYLDCENIEEKIKEKAIKIKKYSENIKEIRLLLVCNRLLNSGKFVYIKNKQIEILGFNEVYFLSYPDAVCKLSS